MQSLSHDGRVSFPVSLTELVEDYSSRSEVLSHLIKSSLEQFYFFLNRGSFVSLARMARERQTCVEDRVRFIKIQVGCAYIFRKLPPTCVVMAIRIAVIRIVQFLKTKGGL